MKRYLALLLTAVLLIISLSGCTIGGVKQTNKSLTIWLDDPNWQPTYQRVLSKFQSTHPGVDIKFAEMPVAVAYNGENWDECQTYMNETLPLYHKKLRDELIVGKGPDIILFSPDVFEDINKTMASGVFTDLKPFLEQDTDYKPKDFQQGVISGGAYKDMQLHMPLFFELAGIAAPQENLQKWNFDFSKTANHYEFLGELARFSERNPTVPIDAQGRSPLRYFELTDAVKLDYENQEVVFDEPRMKQLQEWCKTIYHAPKLQFPAPEDPYIAEMCEGKSLLCTNYNIDKVINFAYHINTHQKPIVTPYHNADGKVYANITFSAAIIDTSQNRQNAYDFLKLALSPITQTPSNMEGVNPVRTSILATLGEKQKSFVQSLAKYESNLTLLPDEYYDQMQGWLNEVDSATFPSNLDDMILEYFEPYYKGENSYENCLKYAKDQLEIYISE